MPFAVFRRPACRLSGAAIALLLSPAAHAVDGVWTGPGSDWASGFNWSSSPTVPDGAATFTNNGAPTTVMVNRTNNYDASIGTLQFTSAAPAYSFTVNAFLNITGAGIVNGSSSNPTFLIAVETGITFHNSASAGGATFNIPVFSQVVFSDNSRAGNATFVTDSNFAAALGNGQITFENSSSADGATLINNNFGWTTLLNSSSAGTATIVNNNNIHVPLFTGIAGGTFFAGTATAGRASITNNDNGLTIFLGSSTAGNATIVNNGGVTAFADTSSAGNATLITNNAGLTSFYNASTGGQARFITNAGGTVDLSNMTPGAFTAGSIEGAGRYLLGTSQLVVGSNNLSTVVSGVIADGGQAGGSGASLVKVGTGNLVLSGNNLYSGGTTISGGAVQLGNGGTSGSILGNVVNNGILAVNRADTLTLNGTISGTGSFVQAGTGTTVLGASNTYSGSTAVLAGTLSVIGGIAGNVAVNNGASLLVGGRVAGNVANAGAVGGAGTIAGSLFNGGLVSPGNGTVGTLTVGGNYGQNGGSIYATEVFGSGQSDRISVGGAASLAGTVLVTALPGLTFAADTTYTILSAAGGINGTFAGVNEFYPFLLSSLRYDANNVYLTLKVGGFAAAAANPLQYAVGNVLDTNVGNATGDFANVLSGLAVNTLSTAQGQAVLQSLSGNNYAGFSTSMVQGMQLFMNNFANQTGGGGSPVSNRVALAEACDVACDATTPPKWGAWGGALGGLGTVGANQSVGSVTYNAGGFAAGLDRALTDSFRVGVTAGYITGTQWVGGFDGLGRSDTFQAGLYGGFAQDKVYADAVIGYAYSWNQMWRNIPVPGLPTRTAQGRTGANQFYGQLETGYRFDIGTNANAFVTPFARLQAYTGAQNAFTETGAQSLNLTVAQQTTNALRSVLGAQIGGSMDLGWREKLAVQLRLGWSHEYADVGRPVTATLAGAPAMPFTTFGVAPQRDGVVLGLSANTAIADATSVYLRYEGNVSGQDNAHAITAGMRMTW